VDAFGRINNKTNNLDRPILRRSGVGLRMAPMIDMIFLLLIFFLAAAKWRPKEDFLPLQLSASGIQIPVGRPEPLLIQIAQNDVGCRVQIGSSYIVDIPAQNPDEGLVVLMEQTRQCLLEQKRYAADPVEIICGSKVKWEYLAKIYNVLFGMGLTDITFRMTEAPENDAHR